MSQENQENKYSKNGFMNKLAETILESDVKLNAIQKGRLKGLFMMFDEQDEKRSKIDEKGLIDVWEMPNFTIVSCRNTWSNKEEQPIVYYTYIDGRRQTECSYNFDQQLLISMANYYDGINSQFPCYAARMLDMDKKYQD